MITERRVREALPAEGFLKEYVEYAEGCTDAPLLYHVGTALVQLTQVAPIRLCVEFGGQVFSNVFVMIVGPSTTSRKTAAIKIGTRILREANPTAISEDPGSPEYLIDSMRGQARQCLSFEEFGHFLASSEQNYKTPIKTVMNQLWDCSPVGRGTVRSKKGPILDPRMSIIAGCAPGYLERHTELVDWTDGFFARWIVFAADRERRYPQPIPNYEGRARLTKRLSDKLDLDAQSVGECRGFASAANEMWNDWFADIERLASDRNDAVAPALHRAATNALKMAMLLSWDFDEASYGQDWQLTTTVLKPALAFADMHVESIRQVVANLASSYDMLDRRAVLAAINGTPTTLGQILVAAKLLRKRALPVIESLLEEGTIESVSGTEGLAYRRRRRLQAIAGGMVGNDADAPDLIDADQEKPDFGD